MTSWHLAVSSNSMFKGLRSWEKKVSFASLDCLQFNTHVLDTYCVQTLMMLYITLRTAVTSSSGGLLTIFKEATSKAVGLLGSGFTKTCLCWKHENVAT